MTARRRIVRLSEDAEEAIIHASDASAPFETGGVLLGVRFEDGPWIVTVAHMVGAVSVHSFVIPHGATSLAVDVARAREPRLGYLGDWHSHPANVGPSDRDLRTLASLARSAVHGPRVIAVARRARAGWQVEVWEQRRLRWPGRCEIVRTGGLIVWPTDEIDPRSLK